MISKIALEKLSVDETINDDIISIVKQNENSFRSLGYYANNSDYDENLKIIINGEIKRRWECIKQYIRDNDLLKYTLEIGLTVGDTVTLTKVGLFESPLTVMDETQQTEIQVGIKAAQHIVVTPIAAD